MIEPLPNDLKIAIQQFEELQHDYRVVGASDSEPTALFHYIIRQALDAGPVEWEKLDWDLYDKEWQEFCSDAENKEQVKKAQEELTCELTYLARKVYDIIRKCMTIDTVLRAYAWRGAPLDLRKD